MISVNPERVGRLVRTGEVETTVRRFGPWPWYLSAAGFIGLDVDVADDVAGDLVEECAGVSGASGILARAWGAGQVLRSIPYLAISTLRRGHPRARRRLFRTMVVLTIGVASVIAAIQMHVGPPARIGADRGFNASDIVINNVRFVQMPIRALDARGHTVTNAAIRYERVGGDPIDIQQSGAVACHSRGDAVVRASLDGLSSLITVHCRPVWSIYTLPGRFDFLPGDPPAVVRLGVNDAEFKAVKEMRGSARIGDSSVAALHRSVLIPRGVGVSQLTVSIGDAHVSVPVVVHEIVSRFDNLTPAQRHVAMRLNVARGDTLHMSVPAGTIWVKWMSSDGTRTHPDITAEGGGYCHTGSEAFIRWLPADEFGAYCVMSEGARIRVARTNSGDASLSGALLLERMAW